MHPDVASVTGVPPYAARLRVLHVAQPTSAGVPAVVTALARHQAAGGWDVHVAADLPPIGDGVRQHLWQAERSPVRGVADEVARLRVLVDRVAPDVVVLHSSKAGMVGRLALRGSVPTVFVPHAWSFLATGGPVGRAAREWERFAARWTNVVITVSDGEADAGRDAGIRAPTFVVPNGVPPGWAPAPASARAVARRELGLPDGPLAVCLGRICRQKGQDVLVRAWARTVEEVPDATLAIVGPGSLADLPGTSTRLTASIRLVGPTPRPAAWLAAADVVAVPSRWEGASLATLEALATGRSVVTTDVSGSDVVTTARAGAVVRVGAVQPLADALAQRLSGGVDADREGRSGAEWVGVHRRSEVALERFAAVLARAQVFGLPADVHARRDGRATAGHSPPTAGEPPGATGTPTTGTSTTGTSTTVGSRG